MPARSRFYELPPQTRETLLQELVRRGFGDWAGLETWCRQNGIDMSRSTLHRWGRPLKDKFEAMSLATEHARALQKAAGDEGQDLSAATLQLAQERAFFLLVNNPDIDAGELAKLTRSAAEAARGGAAVRQERRAQKKFAEQVKKGMRQVEQLRLHELSPRKAEKVKQVLLGIASAAEAADASAGRAGDV